MERVSRAYPPGQPESLIHTTIAVIPLVWLALLPRIYVRAVMLKRLRWEDAMMTSAVLVFTAYCLSVRQAVLQIVDFISDQSFQNAVLSLRWLQIAIICYVCGSVLLKTTLAMYFCRLTISRLQRWIIIFGAALYVFVAIPCMIVALYGCGSFSDVRMILKNYLGKTCISWSILGPLNYVASGLNCATDFFYVGVTIRVVVLSKMNKRQRISALVLIVLAALGSICTVVRLAYVKGLSYDGGIFPSITIAQSSLWELALGIMASCLATLKPLFARFYATVNTVTVTGETFKEDHHVSVQPMHGVGILSGMISKTGLSTVSSAILRRIRKQDFAVFGGEDMSYMRSTPTYKTSGGTMANATNMMSTIDQIMETDETLEHSMARKDHSSVDVQAEEPRRPPHAHRYV